jgi:hypothetical protein
LRRSLDPRRSPWSPVTNFLLNTWFLWIGFYNFYLGMALCAFLVGYAIRHMRAMTSRRMVALGAGLVVLFFTHVLSLSLALMAIVLVAFWVYIVAPLVLAPERQPLRETLRNAVRPVGLVLAAVAPAVVLLAVFVGGSGQSTHFQSKAAWAWNSFPMHVFASARGRTGEQLLLYPAMLFFMVAGVFAMSRREWASAKGALVVVAALAFLFYLVVPNAGFGGDEIKIRFSWAVFVFGCVVASSVMRLQALRTPLSIYVACFLTAALLLAMKQNVRGVSRAVDAYTAALDRIPAGSSFVRLRYPTESSRQRFGFDAIALEPMFHADAWVAARRRLVDLSDYQALSHLFPVVYRPSVSDTKQRQLWALEGMGTTGAAMLADLRKDFPVPIDYVVVLGDPIPKENGVGDVLAELDTHLKLVSGNSPSSFVRVYQAGDYFTGGTEVRR